MISEQRMLIKVVRELKDKYFKGAIHLPGCTQNRSLLSFSLPPPRLQHPSLKRSKRDGIAQMSPFSSPVEPLSLVHSALWVPDCFCPRDTVAQLHRHQLPRHYLRFPRGRRCRRRSNDGQQCDVDCQLLPEHKDRHVWLHGSVPFAVCLKSS